MFQSFIYISSIAALSLSGMERLIEDPDGPSGRGKVARHIRLSVNKKKGVATSDLRPEITRIFPTIETSFWECTRGKAVTLTSGTESAQGRVANSLHKVGLAVDFRGKHLSRDEFSCIARDLSEDLPRAYYVHAVFYFEGAALNHFHIEFDPE